LTAYSNLSREYGAKSYIIDINSTFGTIDQIACLLPANGLPPSRPELATQQLS
jgi:hypothetical protein